MPADRSLPSSGDMAAFRADLLEELAALYNGIGLWLDAVAGTNTITGTITPSGALAKGQRYLLIPVAANTGAVTVNGVSLRDPAGNALTGYELIADRLYPIIHDGTNFRLERWPVLVGSAVYNPPSIAAGARDATAATSRRISVPGAAMGDHVKASFSLDRQGMDLDAWVQAAGVVEHLFSNPTAGSLDLGSGTIYLEVTRRH